MHNVESNVLQFLNRLGIPFQSMQHAPAHTMELCAPVEQRFGCVMPKNLFLTTRSKNAYYLCILRPNAHFQTSSISKQAGSARLSFAPAEDLATLLNTRPGAISPLGLMFDLQHKTGLLIDSTLKEEPLLAFHPCVNTASLVFTNAAFFQQLLPALDVTPLWVNV